MANKTVNAANIAAEVVAGYLDKLASNSTYAMYTYVTERPHNFFVGAAVNVVGLATTTSGVASRSVTVSGVTPSIPNLNMTLITANNFFSVGTRVKIAGVTSTNYNGDFTIIGRSGTTAFTVYNTSTAAVSSTTDMTAVEVIDMNVVNGLVAKVNSPTSFSVIPATTVLYEPGIVMTGPATAQLINGSLNSVKVAYASPKY